MINEYLILFNKYLYLLAKIGFDTAENEPSKVWYKAIIRSYYNAWIPSLEPKKMCAASSAAHGHRFATERRLLSEASKFKFWSLR